MLGLGGAKLFVKAYTNGIEEAGGFVAIVFMVAGQNLIVEGVDLVVVPIVYERVFVSVVSKARSSSSKGHFASSKGRASRPRLRMRI